MQEHKNHDRDERRSSEDDQLRGNTMNEAIRQANNDEAGNTQDAGNRQTGSGGSNDSDQTQGMGYTPNDASAVRSGGTTDMDDQTAGGAGLNTGIRQGAGSNLTTKRNVTGSDFDGQNATS